MAYLLAQWSNAMATMSSAPFGFRPHEFPQRYIQSLRGSTPGGAQGARGA